MNISKNNITFIVFTYNEEARLERVIKNFSAFGKVLIADNKSTDKTQEIARTYGCDVFVREEEYDFVENQELVDLLYGVVETDWIYWAFADEMLEEKTIQEILKIIESNTYDIIDIDRKNYFYGQFCHNLYHSRTNKVFKKHAIDFTDNVIHGFGKPTVGEEKIYILPDEYFVHHFISNTASSYLNVINRYTDSELKFEHKHKGNVLYFALLMIKCIIRDYFMNKGYKAGFAGLALMELTFYYTIVKNIKFYEKKNELTSKSIETLNNMKREAILNVFESK